MSYGITVTIIPFDNCDKVSVRFNDKSTIVDLKSPDHKKSILCLLSYVLPFSNDIYSEYFQMKINIMIDQVKIMETVKHPISYII